jgi:hypothetical protein
MPENPATAVPLDIEILPNGSPKKLKKLIETIKTAMLDNLGILPAKILERIENKIIYRDR